MPCEAYIEKRFNASTRYLITHANAICAEYAEAGFALTIRQLYYQFVARGLLPNKQREYKRLVSAMSDARLAGLLDWSVIVDRTRNLKRNPHWDTPKDLLQAGADQFAYDKWAVQPVRVEVWIEKDALVGVVEPACKALDVPFFACRGYTSQSEQWRAAKRFLQYENDGQDCIILHFGDHDPSGIDMTRDNLDRLGLFGSYVEVRRIALNMDQVEEYGPPANPAKMTDSRFEDYAARYGEESWELDALEPRVIDKLIRQNIAGLIDLDLWKEERRKEIKMRRRLQKIADEWVD